MSGWGEGVASLNTLLSGGCEPPSYAFYLPRPATLHAVDAAGKAQVFAGCYVVAPVNPAIQALPFRPLQIQSGKLAPVETAFEAKEPGVCE